MLGYDKQNRLVVSGISETYLEQLANLCHYWEKFGDRSQAIAMVEWALGYIPGFSAPMGEMESKITKSELLDAMKRDPRWYN